MSMRPARWSAKSISRPSATPTTGLQMIMIGHEGHPETVGTMGQLPEGEVLLVETVEDVATVECAIPQSWLLSPKPRCRSMTPPISSRPCMRGFPRIVGPHKEDICYATTNRQEAVKAMAPKCDAMLVVGAPNSSNSKRLVEVGARAGLHLCATGAAGHGYRLARAGRDHIASASPPAHRPRSSDQRSDRRLQRPL